MAGLPDGDSSDAEIAHLLDEARSLQQKAERALRARDELLAVVSHDLRNPMNVIALSMAALSRYLPQPDNERVSAQVQRMRRSLATMERLLADLVDIGSIDAGALHMRIHDDDLTTIVNEALDLLRPLAAQRGQDLSVEVPSRIPVRADRQRIVQVLSNLIGNAIKFTPPQGWIRVRARLKRDCAAVTAEVEVADSGKGIKAEDLPCVFERFWRASGHEGDGMGLGLSIAKAVIDAHGGTLSAESPAGAGAVFRFTLPAV